MKRAAWWIEEKEIEREERRRMGEENEGGSAPLRSFFSLAQRLTGIFCRPAEDVKIALMADPKRKAVPRQVLIFFPTSPCLRSSNPLTFLLIPSYLSHLRLGLALAPRTSLSTDFLEHLLLIDHRLQLVDSSNSSLPLSAFLLFRFFSIIFTSPRE